MDLLADQTTGFILAVGGLLLLAAPNQDDFFIFGHTITSLHVAIGLLILGLILITTSHDLLA